MARAANDTLTDNMTKGSPVYTIGYGGRPIEAFVSLLETYGIEYLLDVRSWPKSNREDYSKEGLREHLQERGIQYAHWGHLLGGRPDDPDCYRDGHVDYDACRQKNWFRRGIDRLRTAQQKQHTVVLMCSEQRPEECHRSKMIGVGLDEAGIDVRHIDENGDLRTQQEILTRITKNQHDLFGEAGGTGLHSRKSYDS
jgi:uncharacterized protein (DUF488 family)